MGGKRDDLGLVWGSRDVAVVCHGGGSRGWAVTWRVSVSMGGKRDDLGLVWGSRDVAVVCHGGVAVAGW
jgi:hypothetical protein